MIVYHYTTKSSFNDITTSGQIAPSNPWTTMDSAYGTGWYFTDLGPDTCDMALAYHCWNDANILDRVQYYLQFDVDTSILKKCRQHVYILSTWDAKLIKYIGGYQNKECSEKPCSTCEKGKKYRV